MGWREGNSVGCVWVMGSARQGKLEKKEAQDKRTSAKCRTLGGEDAGRSRLHSSREDPTCSAVV